MQYVTKGVKDKFNVLDYVNECQVQNTLYNIYEHLKADSHIYTKITSRYFICLKYFSLFWNEYILQMTILLIRLCKKKQKQKIQLIEILVLKMANHSSYIYIYVCRIKKIITHIESSVFVKTTIQFVRNRLIPIGINHMMMSYVERYILSPLYRTP